jgi:hypothetical protein
VLILQSASAGVLVRIKGFGLIRVDGLSAGGMRPLDGNHSGIDKIEPQVARCQVSPGPNSDRRKANANNEKPPHGKSGAEDQDMT